MNNHITVMLEDAVRELQIQPNKWYLDATLGSAGHTKKILANGGNVIAFDFDSSAIAHAESTLQSEITTGKLLLIRDNFSHISNHVLQHQNLGTIGKIHGVLFDFGTSTQQLTSQKRGFSFEGDGPLDMRMDQRLGVQAQDLLAVIPEKQLAELFRDMGGEPDAKRIAKKIKQAPAPITSTQQLVQLIYAVKGKHKRGVLHPATKVFQALRIAVNTELDNINEALPQALTVLETGGRIVTIAFHEGEDKIVKQTFRSWEARNLGYTTTKKPIPPSETELLKNQRARSAKMRVFIKGVYEKQ